jgi:hypothetical protein
MSDGGAPKTPKKNKAEMIDVPNTLKQKVGSGGIDPKKLARAEKVIAENNVDFSSAATLILERLAGRMRAVEDGRTKGRAAVESLAGSVMELKAGGGMFRYPLVSEIAGGALNFLETLQDVDKEALEVMEAHFNTLQTLIIKKVHIGGESPEGKALADELRGAIARYVKKHAK